MSFTTAVRPTTTIAIRYGSLEELRLVSASERPLISDLITCYTLSSILILYGHPFVAGHNSSAVTESQRGEKAPHSFWVS
jgi:hypothetical protein